MHQQRECTLKAVHSNTHKHLSSSLKYWDTCKMSTHDMWAHAESCSQQYAHALIIHIHVNYALAAWVMLIALHSNTHKLWQFTCMYTAHQHRERMFTAILTCSDNSHTCTPYTNADMRFRNKTNTQTIYTHVHPCERMFTPIRTCSDDAHTCTRHTNADMRFRNNTTTNMLMYAHIHHTPTAAARLTVGIEPLWPPILQQKTSFSADEITECMWDVLQVFCRSVSFFTFCCGTFPNLQTKHKNFG